jgi:CHASE2 domain-containing sensor protein
VSGEIHYAFAVKMAERLDADKTKRFLERNNQVEVINFKGNIMDGKSAFGTRYFVLDVLDVFEGNFTPDLFRDKAVIMCYMGSYLGDIEVPRTDYYFTPLNKNYVGKAEHDMFGGVVHANILSMILEEDYISVLTDKQDITIAILVCLFNVAFFKIIYGAVPRWYDGITKLIQLFQVLLMIGLMIYLFHQFNLKADFTLALVVIALSGDSIEFYHGVIRNLFSRSARKELFTINMNFLTK